MGANPSFADTEINSSSDAFPVNNVSWLDAVAFCKALTILSASQGTLPQNHEYRLPTEVEWEYACRAGTSTVYYFGDDPSELHNHGWFRGNSQKRIHQVGLKSPNPWNLYDMYGNVKPKHQNSMLRRFKIISKRYNGSMTNVGFHSVRKSFGYRLYSIGRNQNDVIVTLMNIFSHSSQSITLRYIGVETEKKEELMEDFMMDM